MSQRKLEDVLSDLIMRDFGDPGGEAERNFVEALEKEGYTIVPRQNIPGQNYGVGT